MNIEKMREEFEREWGQVNADQGVHFIPELNIYGSELYAQHEYAQMKSSAWFYFQKGWQASREALVVGLPPLSGMNSSFVADGIQKTREHNRYNAAVKDCRQAIEAAGLKVKP